MVEDELVTGEQILAMLRSRWTLEPEAADRGGRPAEMWLSTAALPASVSSLL